MELLYTILLGIISGTLTGLLPGIPVYLGFFLFLPFVPADAFMFLTYGIVQNIGTQFFGSISALYFRVPGESSSFPVLAELDNLQSPEKINHAVFLTTLGSLIATVIAGFAIYLSLYSGIFNGIYMPILLKLAIYCFLIVFALLSDTKYLMNIFLLLFCAACVFYPDIAAESNGALPLYYINSMLALIIIFAMQMIWSPLANFETKFSSRQSKISVVGKIPMMVKYSFIGTIFGLIPQLGATISSYSAYVWEKFRGRDSYSRITASETTNNSAIIFSWFPFLLFGVPITATEVLLLQHLNSFGFSIDLLNSSRYQWQLLFAMTSAGLIYYVLSVMVNHSFYNSLGRVITKRWFTLSLLLFSVGTFYFLNHYPLRFIIVHAMIFVPIGWLIHKFNLNIITMVIGLLLLKDILFTAMQVIQIHF